MRGFLFARVLNLVEANMDVAAAFDTCFVSSSIFSGDPHPDQVPSKKSTMVKVGINGYVKTFSFLLDGVYNIPYNVPFNALFPFVK